MSNLLYYIIKNEIHGTSRTYFKAKDFIECVTLQLVLLS